MSPTDIGLLITVIILLIFNALFSVCETAYSAANKVRLRTLEANGNRRASKVLKLLDNYDKVLTTILIGNTVVTVTTAALATLLFISLFKDAQLGTTVATAVITALVLIFCEITPKMIAKERPEKAGMRIYPFVIVLMVLLFPFTWLFSMWKKLLKKVFRIKNEAVITEDELLTYVETAENEGGIEKHESTLIKSAIEFEDVDVEDVMTPRVNVIAVSESESIKDVASKFRDNGFSRMPVYSGTIDTVIGILHEKDFNRFCLSGGKAIREILKRNLNVARTMKISVALKMLQKAKQQMAVVVDEFGGTSGIVTMEDILEELVGEIWDEHDDEEVFTRRISDDMFMVSGAESLADLFELLDFKTNEEFDSTTVGGFVTEQMGKIPSAGEKTEYGRLEFTVVKATEKRVLEVQLKLLPEVSED
ncbi:MAG: hemolysin family protein [Firmicutes bacterium]|nr:hemolysin family protein [Bacillota bacterium]